MYLETRIIERKTNNVSNFYITCNFPNNNCCNEVIDIEGFSNLISEKEIKIINAFGFGDFKYYKQFEKGLKQNNVNDFPITWIKGTGNNTDYGIYMEGVNGYKVRPILDKGTVIGNIVECRDSSRLYLGNITCEEKEIQEFMQTQLILNKISDILEKEGFQMTDITRTWFYNNDILSWYDKFNEVRTSFYKDAGIFKSLVPASTGIDGAAANGSALIVGIMAIKPKTEDYFIAEVDSSPLQNSATEYGSSFSRAVKFGILDCQNVTVSGTASIDKNGITIHKEDFMNQVKYTISSVGVILKQCNMEFSDVVRGVAYIKNSKDVKSFEEYYKNSEIGNIPIIIVNTIICRDDLLFELEVDAVKLD